jgi:hypothetical protein
LIVDHLAGVQLPYMAVYWFKQEKTIMFIAGFSLKSNQPNVLEAVRSSEKTVNLLSL